MAEYWKNHYNVLVEKFPDSPLKQVQRTLNGKEMDQAQQDYTVEAIISALDLRGGDRVIDLCCGNGLITREIAKVVKMVVGVDFSEGLIAYANAHNKFDNIEYKISNVLSLPEEFFENANKVYLRDSISCLDSEDLSQLLGTIKRSKEVEMFHIGGIPDAARLADYYNTAEKMEYYLRMEKEGTPHMGTWWTQDEFTRLVEMQGLTAVVSKQASGLAGAYYRFDCLVRR